MTALFAIWLLISGLDDLLLDLAYFCLWLLSIRSGAERTAAPSESDLRKAPRKRIAVFIPLWREHEVIRQMIEHNTAAHGYDRCDFFVGVYRNDSETLAAAEELEARFPAVHVAVCPREGPTSKADNLNSIFEAMRGFESARQVCFDIVVTHDAEDIIHPEELRWINYYSGRFDMIQIPVLPLRTPVRELLHGVYCDEFADYQTKELPARQFLGGFLPSCGVGTGYSRRALDRMGAAHGGRVFEPKCLTEDYESGFRLRSLGYRQALAPMAWRDGEVVATRAYFPRSFAAAVRQRTRWMMGISLQSWELHGWSDTLSHLYWFWRDRKGLVGAVVGPVAYSVSFFGAAEWYAGGMTGTAWSAAGGEHWIAAAFSFSLSLQALHMAMRIRFVAGIYGWKFASAAPLRALVGNAVNFLAALCAIERYAASKWSGQPPEWLKTEHAYPQPAMLRAAAAQAASHAALASAEERRTMSATM
jgi:adsorption protein B